jgi:hypothetical protein
LALFVAVCEALGTELQSQMSEFMLTFGRHLSIQSFSAAVELAQKVWKQSLESDDYTVSLFDVVNQDVCLLSLLYTVRCETGATRILLDTLSGPAAKTLAQIFY